MKKEKKLDQNYFIIPLMGGLGNQMFQYAFGQILKKKRGGTVFYDDWVIKKLNSHNGLELEKIFKIKINTPPIKKKKWMVFRIFFFGRIFSLKSILTKILKINFLKQKIILENETSSQTLFKKALNEKVYWVEGYFQNDQYFKGQEKFLQEKFKFPKIKEQKIKKIQKLIKETNSVSIHIRRGDYLYKANNYFNNLLEEGYYEKSINYFNKKQKGPHFFVFSDDLSYCKKRFRGMKNMHFVDFNHGKNSFRDMHLMSLCKNNIIANSSFSWWGAYLNQNKNKTVIAPKKWFINEYEKESKVSLNNYFIQF